MRMRTKKLPGLIQKCGACTHDDRSMILLCRFQLTRALLAKIEGKE